jgi:hypothetical protein
MSNACQWCLGTFYMTTRLYVSSGLPVLALKNYKVGVEYIVLRRLTKGKDWVQADFVDGDEEDGKEWCEGPFHQRMPIRELFGKGCLWENETTRRSAL